MPYDPGLAARLEEMVNHKFAQEKGFSETRMMGGFGYLLNGNMCFGIHKNSLIIRVGTETAAKIIRPPNVRWMDLTGKVMKAWVMVEAEALKEEDELEGYCQLAITFVKTLPKK